VTICAAGSGVADLLLDTGPFVALLDRSERNHEWCEAFFRDFRGRLITTESVLSEAVCLLGPLFPRQKPALDFVLAGGAELVPMMPALLKRCAHLMSIYSDVPMDYADATLVAVAEALGIRDVLTLDRRGFSIYRYSSRGSFRIFPDEKK
jgi:predicted nucleic acid-binding protein